MERRAISLLHFTGFICKHTIKLLLNSRCNSLCRQFTDSSATVATWIDRSETATKTVAVFGCIAPSIYRINTVSVSSLAVRGKLCMTSMRCHRVLMLMQFVALHAVHSASRRSFAPCPSINAHFILQTTYASSLNLDIAPHRRYSLPCNVISLFMTGFNSIHCLMQSSNCCRLT